MGSCYIDLSRNKPTLEMYHCHRECFKKIVLQNEIIKSLLLNKKYTRIKRNKYLCTNLVK